MRVGLGGGEVVDAAPGSHGDMQVERLSIETRDRHTERDRQLIDRNTREVARGGAYEKWTRG